MENIHPSLFFRNNSLQITVIVHPNSPKSKVEITENSIEVFVKEPAEKNKANKAVIKILSKFFSISSSNLAIVKGAKSKTKVLEISDQEALNKVLSVFQQGRK